MERNGVTLYLSRTVSANIVLSLFLVGVEGGRGHQLLQATEISDTVVKNKQEISSIKKDITENNEQENAITLFGNGQGNGDLSNTTNLLKLQPKT